jgi:hypothetical protein
MALLDAAKVPYRYALSGNSPDVDDTTDWEHPEPFQFQHPILKVLPRDGRAFWLFGDGPRYAPMDLLPSGLWGAPVIVCDGASGSLDVLPRGSLEEAGMSTKLDVKLQPEGAAQARISMTWRFLEGYGIKESVKNAQKSDINNFAAQRGNMFFTGAKLKKWEAPRLDDPSVPFSISIDIEAEKVVRTQKNGQVTLQTGLSPSNLKQSFGGTSVRKFDLVLRGWTVTRDAVTIDLGPYACARVPGDVQQESKYGQYSLIYVREGAKLRIERTLTLFPKRVTPAEYKDFLNFLDKVDAAERRPLVVESRASGKTDKDTSKESPKSKKDEDKDDEDK